MIDYTDVLSLNFYNYGQPFSGSYKGLRYQILRLKAKKDEEGNLLQEECLQVIVWPEPFSLAKTADDQKLIQCFDYNNGGLHEAVDWINDVYQKGDYKVGFTKSGLTKLMTKMLLLFLCLFVVAAPVQANAAVTGDAEAEETVIVRKSSTIAGLETYRNPAAKNTLKDTICVHPSGVRKVYLQLYSSSKKAWVTKATFTTSTTGKVTLVYPSDWKNKNLTYWRVKVGANETGRACTSEKITVVTKNRRTYSMTAKSAIIMEAATGNVYYGKAEDVGRANASTTKMMTAILALEKAKLTDQVKITSAAVNTPYSELGSGAIGDTANLKDLLYMLMLPSDNGVATALAIHVSGSVKAFARLMNNKAKAIGCTNTHFVNPHGLDADGHYASARDLAKIGAYGMKYKTFAKVVGTPYYSFRTTKKSRYYYVETTNALLGDRSGACGIKTGTEDNAGYCFVGAYKHNGKLYITVVLGCDWGCRWNETEKLMDYIDQYL